MERTYQVVSAAGHLEVPVDAWAEGVPATHRDKLPKMVKGQDGGERWELLGNQLEPAAMLVSRTNSGMALARERTYRTGNGTWQPGSGDAVQRLREQDADGVDAEVLFPPMYMGAFFGPMVKQDRGAYLAIVQAYNSYLAQEYCKAAPDRLIGCAVVPETGVEDALKEMERCARMGLRAVSLTKWPNGSDVYETQDDKFFSAAIGSGVRLTADRGFGGIDQRLVDQPGVSRLNAVKPSAAQGICPDTVSQGILYGLFDRLPDLKFYFAETRGGWLGFYFLMVDEYFERWYPYHGVMLNRLPSQYYRDHCLFSFSGDHYAVKYRHDVGTDVLMWGSGFPRARTTAPNSKEFLREVFSGVPEAEKRQILAGNACQFFGLDTKKTLTATP